MPDRRPLDFSDLQGIVRFGHGRLRCSKFVLARITDVGLAQQWLAQAPVTTAETVTPLPDTALQIAFTPAGLNELNVSEQAMSGFSEEFLTGMTDSNRSRRLGDTGSNAPEFWQWGHSEDKQLHVLLMLYSVQGEIDALQQQILTSEFDQGFSILQVLESNEDVTTEPFGFADGISQPKIDWEQNQSVDVHRRDKYSNLLALGEIVLGYGNEYGEYTARPLLSPGKDTNAAVLPNAEDTEGEKDLGRNGSYLVFRQLGQDVPSFWQFVNNAVGGNAGKRSMLADAMVGRRLDGSPLLPPESDLLPGIAEKDRNKNNFTFDKDSEGFACPLASHVRRSNPRTGDFPPGTTGLLKRLIRILGFGGTNPQDDLVASTRFHRILRRGRQYGPTLSPEDALEPNAPVADRGLHFICLSANIARQFEFVQNAWSVNAKFSGLQNEGDPIMGNRDPLGDGSKTDNFRVPHPSGHGECIANIPQFVSVLGGAYFFLPGIRALKYISGATPFNNQSEE